MHLQSLLNILWTQTGNGNIYMLKLESIQIPRKQIRLLTDKLAIILLFVFFFFYKAPKYSHTQRRHQFIKRSLQIAITECPSTTSCWSESTSISIELSSSSSWWMNSEPASLDGLKWFRFNLFNLFLIRIYKMRLTQWNIPPKKLRRNKIVQLVSVWEIKDSSWGWMGNK